MKTGRPTVKPSEPSTQVCFRVPVSVYDRLYAKASADRASVPDTIRRAILRLIQDERGSCNGNSENVTP